MSGENTEDNATAKAIVDLQELMRLMREEIKVMKMSGATHAGNNLLQQLGVSDNAMNPGSSGYRSGVYYSHIHTVSSILLTHTHSVQYTTHTYTQCPVYYSHIHTVSSILLTHTHSVQYTTHTNTQWKYFVADPFKSTQLKSSYSYYVSWFCNEGLASSYLKVIWSTMLSIS